MNNTENNVAAQAGDEPMRTAFETWYNGQSNITTALRLGRFDDNGEYMSVTVEQQWQGWKGAMSSPRATADVERDACGWVYEEGSEAWASGCGELWSFIDGGPEENRVKFCQGCGKPVSLDGDVWHEAIAAARRSITIDAAIATTKPSVDNDAGVA